MLSGRVNEESIRKFLPAEKCYHVLVCGPEGFWETCFEILLKVGYTKEECTELIA